MTANNDKGKKSGEEAIEADFIPALTKKQQRKAKLAARAMAHDHEVANIAASASEIVAKRTNAIGGFAAFIGVHAVDFLLGSDSSDEKKKKKKKNKNKQGKKR